MHASEMPCPDCYASFPPSNSLTHAYLGGSPGCWDVFNEILRREFQDLAYFAVHRYTVDAYTVQHPGDQSDRRAAQSINIHLTALCLLIEEKAEHGAARAALGKLAKTYKRDFKPLTPPKTYSMTVKDVVKARSAEEHSALVKKWAEVVWNAWSEHHGVARQWLRRLHQ